MHNKNGIEAATHFPASLFVDVYVGIYTRRLTVEASLKGARIALALALYHGRTGSYPESLQDLVPSYIDAVPKDPFTLKPFFYAPNGGHYLLYSAGENQKDDGGKVRPFQDERFLVNDSDGDLVIVRPPASSSST